MLKIQKLKPEKHLWLIEPSEGELCKMLCHAPLGHILKQLLGEIKHILFIKWNKIRHLNF